MEIIDNFDHNGNEPAVTLKINIPLEINLFGTANKAEYLRIALETLQIHSSTIFSHLEKVGRFAREGDLTREHIGLTVETLAALGRDISESIEENFINYQYELEKVRIFPKDKPLDLSGLSSGGVQ